eukprot:425100_1
MSDLNKAQLQINQEKQYLTQKRKEYLELLTDIEIHVQSINERTQNINAEVVDAYKCLNAAKRVIISSNYSSRKSCCGTGIGGGYCCSLWRAPTLIELLFSTVCLLMGKKCKTWKDVYKTIHQKRHFIESVMRFDTKRINAKTRKKAQKKLMSAGEYERKKLNGKKLYYLIYGYIRNNCQTMPLDINDIIVSFCKDTLECRMFLNLWNDGLQKLSYMRYWDSKVGGFLLWCKAQCELSHIMDSIEPVEKEIKWLNERLLLKQQKVDGLARIIAD